MGDGGRQGGGCACVFEICGAKNISVDGVNIFKGSYVHRIFSRVPCI